ncbi:MAG: hypothetical protein A3D99_04205 [Candidatus Andersenbacteria bacterium RIFCSPHIGHO2_12_FULL_45_11]|uniref:ATPase AAA-type core domain-containing protein n=1 Tax=Candidatus Andersenbacteria bacterium RIFCSPHIGHO2_12_FULL_45_11 TaxID=1797281 RepID=A0A1G1X2I7_9BACT|nr:MAG: hypothetical protein A3D99_04205 [Candidatus Andersenbacteria bacterium RIFCSPHIGHO2_12_FULL_45_11]
MAKSGFPRGSIWRKWDLHVHPPGSKLSDGYKDTEASWKKFVQTLRDSDVEVFGITDYFSVESYFTLRDKIEKYDKKLLDEKSFFPNIELRLDINTNPNSEEVNIHIIFDEYCTRKELEKFLSLLETVNKKGDSTHYRCTSDDLDELGYATACTSMANVDKALKSTFGDTKPYVIVAASNGHGGMRADTKSPRKMNLSDEVDKFSDMFFGRAQDKDYFLKTDRYEDKKIESTSKPVIAGSDSHSFEDCEKFLGKQYTKAGVLEKDITWVKADPTFEGIRQVINEPRERVFIGVTPRALVEVTETKSRYIDSISIGHVSKGTKPAWFDSTIPINPELTAIIGKKGSGKSALADVIALTGKSHTLPENYSFLIEKKFRKKGGVQAKSYEATLTWVDTKNDKANLNENVAIESAQEKVKYLPQKFVETICGEDGVSDLFQEEIDKVIYSYVPEEDRLGTTKLSELVKIKGDVIDQTIEDLRATLKDTNFDIVSLESKQSPSYRAKLQKKLEEKNRELTNLPIPKEVKPPKEKKDDIKSKSIETFSAQADKLDKAIESARGDLTVTNNRLANLSKIEASLATLGTKVKECIEKLQPEADSIGVDLSKIVTLEIKDSSLEKAKEKLTKDKEDLAKQLNPDGPKTTSLVKQRVDLQKQVDDLMKEVDTDVKLYRQYQTDLKDYETKKAKLIGKKGDKSLENITSLEEELKYLENDLVEDLSKKAKKRLGITKSIFTELSKKIQFYSDIYNPLAKFIEREKEEQTKTGNILRFDVGIAFAKQIFTDTFLGFLNLAKDGSFQGKESAQKVLKSILDRFNYSEEKGVLAFLADLTSHLITHKGEANLSPMSVDSQLREGEHVKANFYDLVYGLEYLDVKYKIIFNDKDLNDNEFSPGEKGALLLIFYLLIDKSNIPLIMDQPEENLDNESVFTLLVPYIRKVKQRRQIIIVTHNPNLAVVCDAEQIISATMNKKTNEITYVSGGIENPALNKRVVDVLEGTLPAFDIRDSKYIRG